MMNNPMFPSTSTDHLKTSHNLPVSIKTAVPGNVKSFRQKYTNFSGNAALLIIKVGDL